MGAGRFNPTTQKFKLILSLRHGDLLQLSQWEDAFEQASELLHSATDEQHQFGEIHVATHGTGGRNADAWLMPGSGDSRPGAIPGLVNPDETIHQTLYADGRTRPVSVILHEFGHYAYGLYEEYSDLSGAVGSAACLGSGANGCIMEATTEEPSSFCTAANHDLEDSTSGLIANDTEQELWHGMSCREYMESAHSEFAFYPTLASGPSTTHETPTWIQLVGEQKFVLVVDRSGSMAGDKLTQAKFGADWWVDSAFDPEPPPPDPPGSFTEFPPYFFGVVFFSEFAENPIADPLREIVNQDVRDEIMEAYELIGADGWTAIGRALRQALTQIRSRPRAATQVIVLLTDGHTNRGENPLDVLPELEAEGVRVYTIGIGSSIDAPLLEQIATQTGGAFKYIDPFAEDSVEAQIENALMELSNYASENGGFVTSFSGSTNPGVREEDVHIEEGSSMVTFALRWDNPQALFYLYLVPPEGKPVKIETDDEGKPFLPESVSDDWRLIYSDRRYIGLQGKRPPTGPYKVTIQPQEFEGPAHYRLFVFSQNVHIDGGLSSPKRFYELGEPIPLSFQCYHDAPVNGLQVHGRVRVPTGERVGFDFDRQERGDLHHGIYRTVLHNRTSRPGVYTFEVTAESNGRSVSHPRDLAPPDDGQEGKVPGALSEPPEAVEKEPPDHDKEKEPPSIPAFRRQFKLTVVVGKVPIRNAACYPDSGDPGEELQVEIAGENTRFRQGDTSVDFGKGIHVRDFEVLDELTAVAGIIIDDDVEPSWRTVTITTPSERETVAVDRGFRVGDPES
jgi:hypothetical protein